MTDKIQLREEVVILKNIVEFQEKTFQAFSIT